MSEPTLKPEQPGLLKFVEAQMQEHGAKSEFDQGLWALFAVPAADAEANELARLALAEARFAHQSGVTEDDQWMLYYVDTAARMEGMHWLEHLCATLKGDLLPPSPAQRDLIKGIAESNMPHRIAQQLGEMHLRGELSAGVIGEPRLVRSLLDRLHLREPLYFSAFQLLLTHHLIDMLGLLRQVENEDIQLKNEIVKAGLSRDPFLQSRQDAATGIRKSLMNFFIINPLDQQKNVAITNPYAAFMDVSRQGDEIMAQIDGNHVKMPLASFQDAIRSTRRNLYRGGQFAAFNTQVPWMTEGIAYSFRFIKQRLDTRREVAPLDGLFMLGRAVET